MLQDLVKELRRRRVLHMTAIYVVAAWVSVQVASEVFPAVNIPEGAIRYIWFAMLIGLPVAVFFSWRFDLTASGIRRTPAAHEHVAQSHSLTRLDYGVLGALGLVILATVFTVGQRLIDIRTETARTPASRAIDSNSIAVLPLESLSPNSEDAYFAAGVHDALITSLSRISALKVTSRISARRVDSRLSVPEIGRQLGVAKLLDGSVLMDGDRVRIVVQLVDAGSDLNLWADTFEGDVSDVISMQNEMAQTIADVIQVRLTTQEAAALTQTAKVWPDTYREYLKGMYQFRQASPESAWRGIEILKGVVRKDPANALAHAGLAYGYADIAHSPFPGDAYPKAKAAADIALELEPELAEAHLAVAMYRAYYEWDIEGAERAFKRAIRLNPSLAEAHYHLGWLYELLGPEKEEESLAEGERARALNPLAAEYIGGLAYQYMDACRYEDALRLAWEAIRVDPEHWAGWLSLGTIYAQLGQFDEAIDAHEKLAGTIFEAAIGTTYAIAGLEDKARMITTALEAIPGTQLPIAWIYMNLGEVETALYWISEMEKAKTPWYPAFLGMYHGSEFLAEDQRFQQRAAALGLPDPRTMGCGN